MLSEYTILDSCKTREFMNASIYTQRQHQGPHKVGVSYNENVVKSHHPFRHSDEYGTHSDEYRPSARKMNTAGIPAILFNKNLN
jgi:hypothetical protein